MNGTTVGDALDAAIGRNGKPVFITNDHGTESMSCVREDWAYTRGVQLDYVRPGKPTDNSYIESFNGKLRDECSNLALFADVTHVQQVSAASRTDYSEARYRGALGYLTPHGTRRCPSGASPPRKRRNSGTGCRPLGPRSCTAPVRFTPSDAGGSLRTDPVDR